VGDVAAESGRGRERTRAWQARRRRFLAAAETLDAILYSTISAGFFADRPAEAASSGRRRCGGHVVDGRSAWIAS